MDNYISGALPEEQGSSTSQDEARYQGTALHASELQDDLLVCRIHGWYRAALDNEINTFKDEIEELRMYAGHQWSEQQKSKMAGEKRPTLTLNYIFPIINAVCGEEKQNRQIIKIYGREESDEVGAETFTSLIDWVMDSCKGGYALSKTFRMGTIVGRSWVEVVVDYLNDPRGMIKINNIPRGEIFLDPTSKEEDISDARYLIHQKYLTEDQMEALWPGEIDKIKVLYNNLGEVSLNSETDGAGYRDVYSTPEGFDGTYNSKDGTWQVLETWWCEVVSGWIVLNPQTRAIEELTDQEYRALQKDYLRQRLEYQANAQMDPNILIMQPPPQPLQAKKVPIKLFWQAFVCGHAMLEKTRSPVRKLKRFPYAPFFGFRDEIDNRWFGLVRPIIDPQKQHNVEQSSILHITQSNPKSGWMAPKGGLVNRNKWESQSSQPGFIGEYNPARGKPEQIKVPQIPRHILQMATERLHTMREISGVNVDLMGHRVAGDAGIVMEMRRKQGMTVLETLFDNFRLTKQILGEILIAYIQYYIADDRKVRIIGPRGPEYVQATSDLEFKTFDAIIEETNDTITDKMATLQILQTTLPMLLKAGIPVPPSFVDLLPIPHHVKQEWKAMLMPQNQGQQPPGTPPVSGVPVGQPMMRAPGT